MTPEQKEMARQALEQMLLAKTTGGDEGREMIKNIRDRLGAAIGIPKEETAFLQAHQRWLSSEPDMQTSLWADFGMSEKGFQVQYSQVQSAIEEDAILQMMTEGGQVKEAWVMGYLIGMLSERKTQEQLAAGTGEDPLDA